MTQQRSPYDMIGEAGVVALVESFYDIIDTDPAYRRLRAMHEPDLTPVRQGLARFLGGWLGGPRDWFAGGKCIMGLHTRFAIDRAVAEEWRLAMVAAIAAQGWSDAVLAEKLGEALGTMAGAMVNRAEASAS